MAIGDIYYLFFRHKAMVLGGLLVGLLATVGVYVVNPAGYESEATLMVRYVSDSSILEQMATGERITAPGRGGENVINSEIAILASRGLVEKVIDVMGDNQFVGDASNNINRVLIAERVMSNIQIDAPKNSNIIKIRYAHASPAVAQEFLRRLTELYLQKHVELHRASGAYEFLQKQTEELRARLMETEEDLRKVKHDEGIVSIEDTKKNVSERIKEVTRGLDELETALAASKARAGVLQTVTVTTPTPPLATVGAATSERARILELRISLAGLQKRESELLLAYMADSIPVTNVRKQIVELQRLLQEEELAAASVPPLSSPSVAAAATNTSPEVREERANMAALQARILNQKEILQRVQADASKVDAVEARIVQLQRNKDLQEANYRYFCQSLEHARVDEALNAGKITNINIVQPATLPAAPTRPNLPKKMILALLLGLALGLVPALAQEFVFDTTIRRAAELGSLFQKPFVMTLPVIMGLHGRSRGGNVGTAVATSGGTVVNPAAPPAKSVAHARLPKAHSLPVSDDAVRELFDSVRDHFLRQITFAGAPNPYVLGITSCAHGAGCSTIANELAAALAREAGVKIALVDASTEAVMPVCYAVDAQGQFELLDVFALATAARKEEETAAASQEPKLLSETATAPQSSQAPASPPQRALALRRPLAGWLPDYAGRNQAFAAIINQLREGPAPFVIVDLPPVTETGLTLRVAWLHAGLLVVVPAETITRNVAGIVHKWLIQSDATVFGCILNKRRKYVPNWLCQQL
jgi:uncharacterized protein involved in exopolysaccharide biosynthesis